LEDGAGAELGGVNVVGRWLGVVVVVVEAMI
jgi:hypothetical protein